MLEERVAIERALDSARSMAVIAEAQEKAVVEVRRIAAQFNQLYADTKGVREQLAVYESVREEILGDALFAAARAAVQQYRREREQLHEFVAHVSATRAESDRYEVALRELGWIFPPSIDMDAFWRVGQLAAQSRRTELRQAMIEISRSRDMSRAVQAWMSVDGFGARKSIIRDGLLDHRRKRYRVSIPTLLPVVEGVLVDAFAPGSKSVSIPGILGGATAQDVATQEMLDVVTLLWRHVDFGVLSRKSRQLNRHSILHGRSTRYGTAENSARVVFALDHAAAVIRARE